MPLEHLGTVTFPPVTTGHTSTAHTHTLLTQLLPDSQQTHKSIIPPAASLPYYLDHAVMPPVILFSSKPFWALPTE